MAPPTTPPSTRSPSPNSSNGIQTTLDGILARLEALENRFLGPPAAVNSASGNSTNADGNGHHLLLPDPYYVEQEFEEEEIEEEEIEEEEFEEQESESDFAVSEAARKRILLLLSPTPAVCDLEAAGDSVCGICLTEYHRASVEEEEARVRHGVTGEWEFPTRLKCGHHFGNRCLDMWIVVENQNDCPLCRRQCFWKR